MAQQDTSHFHNTVSRKNNQKPKTVFHHPLPRASHPNVWCCISSRVTKKKGYSKVCEVNNVSNIFVKCDGLKFRDTQNLLNGHCPSKSSSWGGGCALCDAVPNRREHFGVVCGTRWASIHLILRSVFWEELNNTVHRTCL